MRSFSVEKGLKSKLRKLRKRDKKAFNAVMSKIGQVVSSPDVEHYKNLRKPLQRFKRVHVAASFVLVFKYLKSKDLVEFYEFEHHDKVYASLPRE